MRTQGWVAVVMLVASGLAAAEEPQRSGGPHGQRLAQAPPAAPEKLQVMPKPSEVQPAAPAAEPAPVVAEPLPPMLPPGPPPPAVVSELRQSPWLCVPVCVRALYGAPPPTYRFDVWQPITNRGYPRPSATVNGGKWWQYAPGVAIWAH
jgi:hypothetical protein